jgi:hypothetical protein
MFYQVAAGRGQGRRGALKVTPFMKPTAQLVIKRHAKRQQISNNILGSGHEEQRGIGPQQETRRKGSLENPERNKKSKETT